MRSPQTENGFMRIATGEDANDVLLALAKAGLTAAEYQLVLLILRKTWGFNKKEDWIALRQFSVELGMPERTVCRSLKSLAGKGVIARRAVKGRTYYAFNK